MNMSAFIKRLAFAICVLMVFSACRKEYQPQVLNINYHYLVVDGIINTSAGGTFIKLSRTWTISSDSTYTPETGALVEVQDENGTGTTLFESPAGQYNTFNLFSNNQKYRLHLVTTGGSEYFSAYVSGIPTPAIDSVNWIQKNDGLHIYVNTHDPQGSAKYYHWDYEETWEYKSAYQSTVVYDKGNFRTRTAGEDVYTCWRSRSSTEILLASSTSLSDAVIYEKPITFIARASQELGVRYSILVKQYALTEEAYQYFSQLKKNSEQLGSIFSTQPTSLTGNIQNVANPKEPVLGFISAGDMQQMRIFISNNDLNLWGYQITGCEKTLFTPDQFDAAFAHGDYLPISQAGLINYYGSGAPCVDCRSQGGDNVKPAFW